MHPNYSSWGSVKGHDTIRGSGPLTIDQAWEAAVFESRLCVGRHGSLWGGGILYI